MFYPALAKEAIDAALSSQWDQAIALNLKILENNPNDLESLNRLARAYLEVGDLTKSKKTYKEVLAIDPYNVIAQKNLKKFQLIKSVDVAKVKRSSGSSPTILTTFIEEPGKTKVVNLVRIADPSTLFRLCTGQKVQFMVKSRGISIAAEDNTYIGRLPDDFAYSLSYLMQGGNQYEGYIKMITPSTVVVFIRETRRDSKFALQPSFPAIGANNTHHEVVEEQTEQDDDASDESEEASQ